MGKVLKTVHSPIVPNQAIATYVHAATYDSHNRVRIITYPDGEVVTYGYDAAGQGNEHQVYQAGQGGDDCGAGGLRQGRAHHIQAHGQRHGKHVRLRPPARAVAGHAANGQRRQHHANAI